MCVHCKLDNFENQARCTGRQELKRDYYVLVHVLCVLFNDFYVLLHESIVLKHKMDVQEGVSSVLIHKSSVLVRK